MNEKVNKILNGEGSKSKKMLDLYNEGLQVGEIAKLMGVRYNFVYNVVSNDCRKNGNEVRVTRKQGTVKTSIIERIDEGKTNTEISKELGVNYNYVFKVRKEYEATKA
jgi:transposase-like protein